MTASDRPQALAWDTPAAAAAYRNRDMRLARQLIFPAVLDRVGVPRGPGATVLDVGCGTGALALELAQARGWSVQGVDPSAHILDIARADRADPRVDYRLFDGRSLAWIPDGSIDAAVCCLVYCTDPDDTRLAALTAEIHRVLRPSAPYVLADLNPDAVGERFATLRFGDEGASYSEGDPVPTVLRQLDGTSVTTACYYRPLSAYRALLTGAGFPAPATDTPALPESDRPAGSGLAPYLIIDTTRR
ncbi:class I SAM-dependent methyltransferase [Streptomyces sasae]|uniref:class I SAM-dependent methyltransferase n=1 Tax=Streptomyces sasae TaxID=1266772 RepID=UPI00292E2CD4|nr:class I SAM-dependent methyltransferase [Streptomyces sasae]